MITQHFRLGSYLRFLVLWPKLRGMHGKTILDIGSNYGEIAKYAALHNRFIGIDTDSRAITVAQKTVNKAMFLCASATDIPFPKHYVDVVMCLSVLEHVRDDRRVLAEIRRVLKKDGQLILTVPSAHFSLIPGWLTILIRLINRFFHTHFPSTDSQYVHFGTEGIGHVRRGYTLTQISTMLAKEHMRVQFASTYWHAPSRFGYVLLTPLVKTGFVGERVAKLLFTPFFLLDRLCHDDKGDIVIYATRAPER